MADLEKDFDKETDLSKQFDSESDLHSQFDKEPGSPSGMGESAQMRGEIPHPSKLESGLRGAAQGLTFGFSDEALGAGRAALEKVIPSESTKDMALKDLYQMYRDMERAKNKAAEQENPKTYLAGNVAGGLATMAVPGLGEMNLGKAAALGAAGGLGSSEADLTKGDIKGAAKDVALGTGMGMAGYGAGKVAGLVTGKIGQELEKRAARQMEGAVGIPKTATSETIGKTLMSEEAVPMTGGMKGMAQGIDDALENKGKELSDALKEAQSHIELQTPEGMPAAPSKDLGATVLNRFNNDILGKYNKELPQDAIAMTNIVKNTRPFVKKVLGAGDDLVELNKIKQDIYRYTRSLEKNAWKEHKNVDPEVDALKQLGGMVRQHIEDTANSLNDQQLGSKIKQLNQQWADLNTSAIAVDKSQQAALAAERAPIESQLKKNLVTSGLPAAAAKAVGLGYPGALAGAVAGYAAKEGIEHITGYPIKQAGQIAASKVLGAASKISEPASKVMETSVQKGINSPFTQDIASGRSKNLNPAYMVYQASDDQLKQYHDQIKDKPSLVKVSSALERYFQTGDVMDKNKAAFLIQSTPEAKEALGFK